MNCYAKYMGEVLDVAGIDDTNENRKKLDLYLKTKYNLPQFASSCPEVCKIYLKPLLSNAKQKSELIGDLNNIFYSKKKLGTG